MLNTQQLTTTLHGIRFQSGKASADDAARHILFVVEKSDSPFQSFSRQNMFVTLSTVEKASAFINELSLSSPPPDVILVSAELENYTDSYLLALKEFANQRHLPFILYSETFNNIARSIASEFGFDDYYTGNLSDKFLKKTDFIRRLKVYKGIRNTAPYMVSLHRQPKVKMWALKRAFDVIVSSLLLLILSPVMLLIALIVKLESKGPVFYISKRAGNGYTIFDFYKFRSMYHGADVRLKELSYKNQYGDAVFFKIRNDPRITRFGKFLRNTSLDELPQLINVLKGDMSLVGNRPLPLYEAEKLTKDQIAWRFLAPAGITGLWQVTKRGKENMSEEERIQLDMQYAMNSSFLSDLKILFNTIPALLQKEQV